MGIPPLNRRDNRDSGNLFMVEKIFKVEMIVKVEMVIIGGCDGIEDEIFSYSQFV